MSDKLITVSRKDLGFINNSYLLTFTQHYADGGSDSYPVVIIGGSLNHGPKDLLRKVSKARNNLSLMAKGRQLTAHKGLTLADYIKQQEITV